VARARPLGSLVWRGVARLLSALLIALALAGCGESAEDKYREEFPKIDRQLAALAADVGTGLRDAGGSDDRALAGEFGRYARRLGELRGRLDDLETPGPLKKDHQALLTAMAATRGSLADVAAAAQRSDPAAAREAATRLVREGERLDEARGELAAAVRRL
jgi:hypothetical protein